MGNVVRLDGNDSEDIVKMLRGTADRIESGELPDSPLAIFAMKGEDSVYVFGWGRQARSLPELHSLSSYVSSLLIRNY